MFNFRLWGAIIVVAGHLGSLSAMSLADSSIATDSPAQNEARAGVIVEEVRGPTFHGVIMPSAMAADYWVQSAGRAVEAHWAVDEQQIHEMESLLANYVKRHRDALIVSLAHRLPSYKRQYFPAIDQGQRQIRLFAMCDMWINEGDTEWMRVPQIVSDGGDCFFEVLFNADEKSFTWIRVNGEA